MKYGRGIKIARTSRGMTQKALAAELRVSAGFLSLIESGKRKPSVRTLESISKSLGVPLHLLVLLSSDEEDLANIGTKDAMKIGHHMLQILMDVPKVPNH